MAKSKPKSSIKLSSNWEKNMAALGTPAKVSASKSSSSKSSSSKSSSSKVSASKPSSPAKASSSKPAKPASSAKVPAKSPAKLAAPAKTPAKPATVATKTPAVATPAKSAGKTVSQVWKEKTGMDWSEAKKLGLSDGSAKSNLALLAKLNSGATSRADLGVKVEPIVLATKKNEPMAAPELVTKRKGGPVRMKKGGMKKKSC